MDKAHTAMNYLLAAEKRKRQGEWKPEPNSTVLTETDEGQEIQLLISRSQDSWSGEDWQKYHQWYERQAQANIQRESLRANEASLPKRKIKISAGLQKHLDMGGTWWTYEKSPRGRKPKSGLSKSLERGLEMLGLQEKYGLNKTGAACQYITEHPETEEMNINYLVTCMKEAKKYLIQHQN